MPKFHRIAAFCVMIGAVAWIATGEFSSVGSAQTAEGKESPTAEAPAAITPLIRTVSVADPAFIDHARAIRLSGITEADKRVELAARADGVIAALAMTKGGMVEVGAEVMTLEGPEAVAQEEIARIALDQKERDLEVAQKLFEGGSTSESNLTNARSARDAAAAELARAQATADRLRLKAPFAGVVDAVSVELGEWVQTGTPVATILSLDPILVKAEVSEVDLAAVAVGSTAKVRLANGTEMEGTVRLVAREASAQTRTFPVEIALPNPRMTLPSGMTAQVSLFAQPVRAVVVPRSIITLSDTGELGLRVVGKDNVAKFAAVQIIDDTPEGLVVMGVPEDVRIVTAGQDLVRDGDTVEVASGVGQ
ncbi:efflux RND transporter periplasmic adaptor subunit [Tabrizicola sp.]|uniref:efflux RND transporter periplasmic adaptor subunit n=1 Tax=Tabrizicola sp. TaxID=2005166 RepID=UPI0025F09CA7|nr:efflux RND transporter periplasmic adaptor subunit [Tabrizicola sp.]